MDIRDWAQLIIAIATSTSILLPVMRSLSGTKKRLDCIERTLLMLTLHDEHLPERERLNAGKRYLDMGGNGATKVYYEELEIQYRKRFEHKMKKEDTLEKLY